MRHGWIMGMFLVWGCVGMVSGEINRLTDAEKAEGFVLLFDGNALDTAIWDGDVAKHQVKDGLMIADPGGQMYTREEYANFIFRVDFCLPKGGNNGIGIRCLPKGSPGRTGMEVQILDDYDDSYKGLDPSAYTASLYGVVGPKPGLLKPHGEWNSLEIVADGPRVKTILNGQTAVDIDLSQVKDADLPLNVPPRFLIPGFRSKSGRIAFAGHDSPVQFRNIRVKRLPDTVQEVTAQ
ncbi:MAG: DUF1080 domain-containing protein [Planctomycetia bacterium]|nr:DUF1080 domain-containing protein [Planctomycetia bacterium]